MTSSRVLSSFWTAVGAVLAVLTGIGALLGLRRGRPAGEPAAPAAAPAATARVAAPVFTVPAARANRARRRLRIGAGALPPTIKQRIGAEAHGSSPAARRTAPGVSRRAEDFELTA